MLRSWQVEPSNRNPQCMWGSNSDAILLTHRQVFPFNIIIMYMRTKYTRLLSIISQSSFPLCKNYGPRTVPISCRCQQHRSDYNPVLWASYQIRKIAGCACARNVGIVFPHPRFQRKPLVSDPDMHHGTCVTHVPDACRDRLPAVTGKTFPAFPAHAHLQFCVSGKRPMAQYVWHPDVSAGPDKNMI